MRSSVAEGLRPITPGPFRVALMPALAAMTVTLATASRYGFHGDELYFRALPWAWWYEDQPPLTVWLARIAAQTSDAVWVQRIPAVLAAGAGAVVAAGFPRVLGKDVRVQRTAAWAHSFAVYPLLMGHVLLTSTLDLLAWQGVALCVVAALAGRQRALAYAGVIAGVACWNKLLILVFVAALITVLVFTHMKLLRTRSALIGAATFGALAAPQVAAQLLHGMPMTAVSSDLLAAHATTNRWLVLPLLIVFLGPPFLPVWWRGVMWRPRSDTTTSTLQGRTLIVKAPPVLGLAAALVLGWAFVFPAQPYYAVAAFLPALAVGWGEIAYRETDLWKRSKTIIGAEAVVAVLMCLPLVPPSSPAFGIVEAVNPVLRDEVGWPDLAREVAAARGGEDALIVTDSYALAGALLRYGPDVGVPSARVASGHNALWDLGPPRPAKVVVLTGRYAAQRDLFDQCESVGQLRRVATNPFSLAGTPMLRCTGMRMSWQEAWPRFRHLGG